MMGRAVYALLVILVFAGEVVGRIVIGEGVGGYSVGSTAQFPKCDVASLNADRFTVGPVPEAMVVEGVGFSRHVMKHSAARAEEWDYLRIVSFTEDLHDVSRYCSEVGQSRPNFKGEIQTCTERDILTSAKRDLLEKSILPAAAKMQTERLKVHRVTGAVLVPSLMGDVCTSFSIPDSHKTAGVEGYDFLFYVASGTMSAGIAAWATYCATIEGRPSVGVSNYCPEAVDAIGTLQGLWAVQILTHEMSHALGFIEGKFVGEQEVTGIRGKSNSVTVLSSPAVLRVAREYFGWDAAPYVELEDEGGAGTAGSHWKARVIKDDILTSEWGSRRYSAFTLAVFEDMGYYKPDYSKAEGMYFGYKGGERMLMDKCVENGVSQNEEFFCTTNDKQMCTSSRDGLGVCKISTYNEALDKPFQYFSDPKVGGTSQFMDYCPVVTLYMTTRCADATPTLMPGSIASATSICVDTLNSIQTTDKYSPPAICVEVECNSEKETYKIKALGGSTYGDCEPGKTFDLPSHSSSFESGSITCPSYASMCSLFSTTSADADAEKGEDSGSGTNEQDGTTGDDNSDTEGNGNSSEGGGMILCKCESKKSALENVL